MRPQDSRSEPASLRPCHGIGSQHARLRTRYRQAGAVTRRAGTRARELPELPVLSRELRACGGFPLDRSEAFPLW